jgi:hypothetical protein
MKKVKLFEEFISEYKNVAYDTQISGEYELVIGAKKYNINVAGFEREGDKTDSLYLMDNDPQKEIIGSVIVKNSDMIKMSKGTKIDVSTSKNFMKGTLIKLNENIIVEGKVDSTKLYPLRKTDNPEKYLSGKTADEWVARNSVDDLIDIFGNNIDISKGDGIAMYLLNNGNDDDYIYRIRKTNLKGTKYFYIPSIIDKSNQYDEIQSSY